MKQDCESDAVPGISTLIQVRQDHESSAVAWISTSCSSSIVIYKNSVFIILMIIIMTVVMIITFGSDYAANVTKENKLSCIVSRQLHC